MDNKTIAARDEERIARRKQYMKEYMRKYRAAHPEKIKRWRRDYYARYLQRAGLQIVQTDSERAERTEVE